MNLTIEEQQERELTRRCSKRLLGIARGIIAISEARGRAELVIKLLALRFGLLTEAVRRSILNAQREKVEAVAERMLTANTLEEALRPLS